MIRVMLTRARGRAAAEAKPKFSRDITQELTGTSNLNAQSRACFLLLAYPQQQVPKPTFGVLKAQLRKTSAGVVVVLPC